MKTLEIQLEELEKMRTRWILLNLIGFFLWDTFRIINNYLVKEELPTAFKIILWLGWILWVLGLVQLTRLGYKMKKTKLATQVLNDELVELIRLKSWRLALIAVILTQAVIILSSVSSNNISGILSAEISILVAVVSATSAFLYYDKNIPNG